MGRVRSTSGRGPEAPSTLEEKNEKTHQISSKNESKFPEKVPYNQKKRGIKKHFIICIYWENRKNRRILKTRKKGHFFHDDFHKA